MQFFSAQFGFAFLNFLNSFVNMKFFKTKLTQGAVVIAACMLSTQLLFTSCTSRQTTENRTQEISKTTAAGTDRSFLLEHFSTAKGVGAASGLVFKNQKIYIISDDSDVLYQYSIHDLKTAKISLRKDGALTEHRPKKEKSDFEAITFHNGFHVFGSGSGINRKQLVTISENGETTTFHSLEKLYTDCKKVAGISDEDFNIEGAAIHKDDLLLFNRGNGPARKNGIFRIRKWNKPNKSQPVFHPVSLPEIGDTVFGFTDALLLDGKIVFLAAAEAVASTYLDGEVLGSMIGTINPDDYSLGKTEIISTEHKFEGLTHFSSDQKKHTFLLCEDPDNGNKETVIYSLKISR